MTTPLCPHCHEPLDLDTLKAARAALLAQRAVRAGGRPAKRTRCAKCKAWCESARAARKHCSPATA